MQLFCLFWRCRQCFFYFWTVCISWLYSTRQRLSLVRFISYHSGIAVVLVCSESSYSTQTKTENPPNRNSPTLLALGECALTTDLCCTSCWTPLSWWGKRMHIFYYHQPKTHGWLELECWWLPIVVLKANQSWVKATKTETLDLCQKTPSLSMRQGAILFWISQ